MASAPRTDDSRRKEELYENLASIIRELKYLGETPEAIQSLVVSIEKEEE